MVAALWSVGFMVLLVVGAAGLLGAIHRGLRPTELDARSATALRELEPRGGRHRFHVRLFEVVAMASAGIAGEGALFVLLVARDDGQQPAGRAALLGGLALLVAFWWAWRRGALRAVEAEPAESSPRG